MHRPAKVNQPNGITPQPSVHVQGSCSVSVIGNGATGVAVAHRLAAAGHDVCRESPATASSAPLRADVIYICVDADLTGHADDIVQPLHAALAALHRRHTLTRGQLIVLHGDVPPGTSDWANQVLREQVPMLVYLARQPDERHGGPIIGADTHEAAARWMALERVDDGCCTVLDRRGAEMADYASRALAASDYEVARELKALAAGESVPTTEASGKSGPGAGEGDDRSHEAAASVLVSLAELAGCCVPVLRSVVGDQQVMSCPLSRIATGRAYLAGLSEGSVDLAGPTGWARQSGRWYPVAKRILDLIVGAPMLLVVSPLMALLAMLILLETGRPILFGARRVGRAGRQFQMLKFRSMTREAPRTANKTETENYTTRVGKLLRATSLDELPQLFNLFAGQMSLVGPRPEQPFIVEWYQPWQRERLSALPGLTGWWQINMRGSAGEMYQHVAYDVWYVRHQSFLLDLRILLQTPLALCGHMLRWRLPA